MPGCVVDSSLVAAAVLGYWKVQGYRESQQRKRFAVLSKISQHVLQVNFKRIWPVTRNVESKLPVGADSSATAALRAVQRYQDFRARDDVPSCLPRVPFPWMTSFYFSGIQDSSPSTDVETAICEELKVWLLGAATGAVPVEEASLRQQFYHQLLMRPETFTEAAFLSLIAVVCERLDELTERMASATRTCALQLNKVINIGRDLFNSLLPVLLLAITNAVGSAALPILCVDVLAPAALKAERDGTGVFANMWQKDSGRLLQALLCSPHLLELWALDRVEEQPAHSKSRPLTVLDVKLEVFWKWKECREAGRALAGSGLVDLFEGEDCGHIQESYLSLVENLDKFVKFMSMMEPYKALANIAGDVAMHHLRSTLHHLLQEIELVLVVVEKDAAMIMEEVRHTVIEQAIRYPKPETEQRLQWLERLQVIDEEAQGRIYASLVTSIAELQYLSCEARLPALQAAWQRSFGQIAAITDSEEFRSRCSERPPEPSWLALPPAGGLAASLQPGPLALENVPAWSLERHFTLNPEEMESLHQQGWAGPAEMSSRAELGSVVERLNRGATPDPGDFYVVRCQDTPNSLAFYRPGGREAAIEALGLNELKLQIFPTPFQAAPGHASPPTEPGEEAEALNAVLAATLEPPEPVVPAEGAQQAAAVVQAEATVHPPAESLVPAAVPEEPPPLGPEEEAARALSQNKFYQGLFQAVLPLFDRIDEDCITEGQAMALLRRSGLPEPVLASILKAGMQGQPNGTVDCQALRLMGQLVAHAQAGCSDLQTALNCLPCSVPEFRGFKWDEARRRLRVLEPF